MIEVTNLNKTIDFLKKNGFWIIGLDSNSNKTIKTISNNIKKVLIFGSEDKGIRKLIKKNCDFIIKIKTVEKDDDIVDSLNVSNACAIILNQLTTKMKQLPNYYNDLDLTLKEILGLIQRGS